MAPSPTDIPAKLMPLAEELLDNSYARENLQEGIEKLRDAVNGKKPKRTGRKVVLTLLGLAAAGAAAVLATNEDLRNQVLGSAKALGEEIAGGSADEGPGSGANGSPS